jgi:PAS domain S-box-containing protein
MPQPAQKIAQSTIEPPGGLDARFCEVMDAAPVMVWVSGKDKGCVWFNQPWLTFTGRRLAEEIGNGWLEGVHPHDFDRCMEVYLSHFDAGKDFRMQYRLRRHDGAYRWVDDTGVPRFAHDGTFLGYIGSCIDVHEHREVQSELSRRLQEITELNRQADAAILAASIAHEINQPLAAIAANGAAGLRWLALETPNLERARGTLRNIIDAEQRAVEIIDSIRAISKREHRSAPLNLNELIREVLALLEAELQSHHVEVRTTFDETIPVVLGDRIQFQQVILNLIKNAVEAMSSVVDHSRALHLKTELGRTQTIVVTVQDSGTGIDLKNIDKIFDRAFTTKIHGMGMGLAICRSIVEAHNGRLWAEQVDQQGSVFRISLPIG